MANMNAGEDLTGKVGLAVKLDGDKVVVATDATAIGIVRNDGAKGEEVGVAVCGEAKAKIGETINTGDALMATAGGKLGKATEGAKVIAVALEDGAVDDLIAVVIDRA